MSCCAARLMAGSTVRMYNERNEELQEALPSTPVKVAGLDIVPGAGEQFLIMSDVEECAKRPKHDRQKGRAFSAGRHHGWKSAPWRIF